MTIIRRRFLYLASAAATAIASPALAQTAPVVPAKPYVPGKVGYPIPKTAKPMKLAVIGAGNVGGALGGLWAKAGHQVMFADRDPAQAKGRATENPGATSGTTVQAIAFADVVVVTVPFAAWPEIAREHGAALKTKIVFETTNASPPRDGAIGEAGLAKGAGLYVQEQLPGVKIARGFTAIGAAQMSSEAGRPAPAPASRWRGTIRSRRQSARSSSTTRALNLSTPAVSSTPRNSRRAVRPPV